MRFPLLWSMAVKLRTRWHRLRSIGQREVRQQWLSVFQSLKQHGRLRLSVEALRRADPPIDQVDQVRRQCADLKLLSGRKADAMVDYQKVLKAGQYRPDLVVSICHFLAVAGHVDETVRVYAEARRRRKGRFKALKLGGRDLQVLPYYWVDRIGHLAFLDSFVKMMIMGWLPARTVILLAPNNRIANMTYLDYWRPYVIVESDEQAIAALDSLANPLEDHYFCAYIAPSGESCWWIKAAWAAQQQWDSQRRRPLLQLAADDERAGRELLDALGIKPTDWFVCLHVRESGFHGDGKGHSQEYRDSDIEQYTLAIEAITERGGWVIRMGGAEMRPIRPNPKVVDYALSDFKSDRFDVFLSARCRFFIATNSGMGIVPSTFGVPAVVVDFLPLANEIYIKNGCFIPKLCWSSVDSRYLTFDECMEAPLGYSHTGETFAGLTIRHNTPDEIKDVVIEMMDRLDGIFAPGAEDVALQAKFDMLRKKHGVVSTAPIGREFLKRHAELLNSNLVMRPSKDCAGLVASFGVPDNTAANNLARGKTFIDLGSFELAAACFREARRLEPGNAEVDTLLRATYFEKARGLVFCDSGTDAAGSLASAPATATISDAWRSELPAIVAQY
jgi:putative glycosyltransferase (TIGR04372 family)